MRDPNRIYVICSQIAKAWHDNVPDWRFTQMLCNFLSYMGSDCFYMEDEVFMKKFNEYMRTLV